MRLTQVSNRIGVVAGDDTRLPMLMLHSLALHEMVEAIDLEVKLPKLLVHGGVLCIRSIHLQGY
jgi:hypothetical protein